MLYIYLDNSQIKLMYVKKSILGQYETFFHSKSFQVDLLKDGVPATPEVIASGIKEALSGLTEETIKDREVTLVLPQEAFLFFRADMPSDVATPEVLTNFLREKARSQLDSDIENSYYDFLIRENENKKKILFYAIKKEILEAYEIPLRLVELNLKSVVPEALSYFKLFEKTLRSNKKENIWYVSMDQDKLTGYVYDSFGLLEEDRWTAPASGDAKVESILHKQTAKYETKNIKLNRLLLSGRQSENVRQDTFTKSVGVWTNPLKRIIPHFYSDYLKMLKGQNQPELPILSYDMLIGAFIFNTENSNFSLLKGKTANGKSKLGTSKFKFPKPNISKKGLILFLVSFSLVFASIFGFSKIKSEKINFNIKIPNFSLPNSFTPSPTNIPNTPTPEPPTPTPTPEIKKDQVKIKILNGSGIVGKAGDVKKFLQGAGYEDILTGNAATFDYDTTVIQTKDGENSLAELIAEDIKSEIEKKALFETLDKDNAADIVIIVGTDFK